MSKETLTQFISKWNSWISRHRRFALSIPIVVLLLLFFITTTLSSMKEGQASTADGDQYNNFLPGQQAELEVQDPNSLYRQSQEDSLREQRNGTTLKNIVTARKAKDSLQQLLNELDRFSLDTTEIALNPATPIEPESTPITSPMVSKQSEAQEKLAYRKLLLEAREQRQNRSQDYSAPQTGTSSRNELLTLSMEASIYRDQFILPGDRVTLILEKDISYAGHRFPENTFVYATATIQGNRVLLEVSNIANVPIALSAKDRVDGMEGLYNPQAGFLFQEFKNDMESEGIDALSQWTGTVTESRLAGNLIDSFGNFFKKKNYKERDKIVLVHGDLLYLDPKE